MGYYRAALVTCVIGDIFLTLAFIAFIYVLYRVQQSPSLLTSIAFILPAALWLLSLVFLLIAFLLSIGVRSHALGLSFGYGAAIHVLFIITIITQAIITQGVLPTDPFLLGILVLLLGIPAVLALLLGIAATKRF
ncbi:MAG: hypothetical protein DJ555_00490 [Desulfurococcaceae archaeon]|nr:MAG: hypothetical protein DJ555_00490 [Desulfurococcaceae archaeon]